VGGELVGLLEGDGARLAAQDAVGFFHERFVLQRYCNAESAEDAENGKDRGTATTFAVVIQSSLCGLCDLCVENTL
jgi:hypothetical protein